MNCYRSGFKLKCINMQWHINNYCNLRCKHCYQEVYDEPGLNFDKFLNILQQYDELVAKLYENSSFGKSGRITLTGGEPLMCDKIFELIEYIKKNLPYVNLSILTNGTLIDDKVAKRLKKFDLHFVQVSLEGDKKTHDAIRGKGSFEKARNGIKLLVKNNIKVTISFTAHKGNYKSFSKIAKIGKKLKVFSVWSDRMIPYGSAENLKELLLTPDETKEYVGLIHKESLKKSIFSKTKISCARALQFFPTKSRPYVCNAGNGLITVDYDGTLYPCRRMPIKIGNLLNNNLADMYFNSEIMKNLRDRNVTLEKCQGCNFFKSCNGGLKCLSFAVNNGKFDKDPGCWI